MNASACGLAVKAGQALRPLLPAVLRNKLPPAASVQSSAWPTREHARKVLMLAGCVQPTLAPNINAATARVLDAAGIQVLLAPKAGCCGAVRSHLGDPQGGLDDMRRNVDAWWPLVEGGTVEAVVMNASACGLAVKEYGHALAQDPAYADRAQHISAMARDLGELLPDLVEALQGRLDSARLPRVAFHPPCTLQHGQKLRGGIETQLRALGFEVEIAGEESHLCCGSAGTYSVLQPELAYPLRDRKLGHLGKLGADVIASANMGCIQHLQSGTPTPVRHWIELLDEALAG